MIRILTFCSLKAFLQYFLTQIYVFYCKKYQIFSDYADMIL